MGGLQLRKEGEYESKAVCDLAITYYGSVTERLLSEGKK